MNPHRNHLSLLRRRSGALGVLVALGCLGLVAACEDSPTQVTTDVPEPQFTHKGDAHGKPGPKPSDPGVPLRITVVSGAFTGDAVSNDYDETLDDGAATHLSGVNGNLMFDLRDSDRMVLVAADGFDGLVKTRIFTNNGPDLDLGLMTEINGTAVLEAEWRTTEPDGKFFYSLRYGKDCWGTVTGPKADVSFDGSAWTISFDDSDGDRGVLCRKKQKGKPGLSYAGSAGAFEMTLVDITPP